MKTHIRFCGAGGHYSYLLGLATVLQKYFNQHIKIPKHQNNLSN